mgnify:CR=1 FL=1
MLEVDKIDVFYGGIQALWGVSLEVAEGELTDAPIEDEAMQGGGDGDDGDDNR